MAPPSAAETMDVSNTVAQLLSFTATAVGLGGLISQANAINDKMDPFHANRHVEYLGIWFRRQKQFPWWIFRKPPPSGPIITASLSDGFCGLHTLHSTLLSILHVNIPVRHERGNREADVEKAWEPIDTSATSYGKIPTNFPIDGSEWDRLSTCPLQKYQSHACTVISRSTLVVLLLLTNARVGFQYSDAAGYRANFASYAGQWYITWPIGEEAVVKLSAHDSHSAKTDVYPPIFMQRVHSCVNMLAGIITSPQRESNGLRVSFCGRKGPGVYELTHVVKGFAGAHGSRHLYNMMGGKVYEVDFLSARAVEEDSIGLEGNDFITLDLLSTHNTGRVRMRVSPETQQILSHALDCRPWTSLSWSLHRGLKDILLAYARPVMDPRRHELVQSLRKAVAERSHVLEQRGWNPAFVRTSMADMAASAVLARAGNSGDLVRVVTDIVMALVRDWNLTQLDEVNFWRQQYALQQQEHHSQSQTSRSELDLRGIVALTKVFVLEWSIEFDYQMYHHLPMS